VNVSQLKLRSEKFDDDDDDDNNDDDDDNNNNNNKDSFLFSSRSGNLMITSLSRSPF
jgi:hypothetical protein